MRLTALAVWLLTAAGQGVLPLPPADRATGHPAGGPVARRPWGATRSSRPATLGFTVTDVFGRDVTRHGLTLVDWEGQIANPAIRFYVRPPASAKLPATATLAANGSRLYFDLPSEVGEKGPTKALTFSDAAAAVPVLVSIFPDRDGLDEDYTLTLKLAGSAASTRVPIHVIDQDKPGPGLFKVLIDYSQDRTGFFDDPHKRAIAQQVADDWAFFFADMHLDTVPAGAESTWIWHTNGFSSGHEVKNATAYKGYLLHAYGIAGPEQRSGGEASLTGFQTCQGAPLPIRRAGGFAAETDGNYNTLGWFLTNGDGDWAHTGNLRKDVCDFASIAHHEIGHALIFHDGHTVYGKAKAEGQLTDPAVVAYLGAAPKIDRFCHMPGAVDPASRRGAFGNEYFGDMPKKRWLITKLDLLVAQAVGYHLRSTSAFARLAFRAQSLPRATAGRPFSVQLHASGGIPFYCWDVTSGTLPPGMTLDSFTGRMSGSPRVAGRYRFTVRVRDYDQDGPGIGRAMTLAVCRSSMPH